MQPVIQVQRVSKRYRLGAIGATRLRDELELLWARIKTGRPAIDRADFWALRDVSFDIRPGEVVGIVGRNGSGKSTLLRILCEITEPTSGEIRIRGRVAALLEIGTGFHPDLSGRDNIFINGAVMGMRKAEIKRRFDEIVEFSGVSQFIDTPVKRYSSGMYVRLAFSVAAHLEPEILILDEVLAVGDADFQKKCLAKLDEAARQGRTILLVTHSTGVVAERCQRAIWMDGGQIRADGPAADVVKAYHA